MFPDQNLTKIILEKLALKYPDRDYQYDRDMVLDIYPNCKDEEKQEKLDTITKHLIVLHDDSYIDYKVVSSRDGKTYWNIKITKAGLKYLKAL